MRIKNETHWSAKDVATLIRRVAEDELDRGQLKNARVQIRYQRGRRGFLGKCSYGHILFPNVRMILCLPREGEVDTVTLAHTIAHELGHAKGIRHADMHGPRYGYAEGWRDLYAWAANGFSIMPKPEKPKLLPEDRLTARLEHASKMVRRWQSKVRRATTGFKTWQRRARYLETRLAAISAEKV